MVLPTSPNPIFFGTLKHYHQAEILPSKYFLVCFNYPVGHPFDFELVENFKLLRASLIFLPFVVGGAADVEKFIQGLRNKLTHDGVIVFSYSLHHIHDLQRITQHLSLIGGGAWSSSKNDFNPFFILKFPGPDAEPTAKAQISITLTDSSVDAFYRILIRRFIPKSKSGQLVIDFSGNFDCMKSTIKQYNGSYWAGCHPDVTPQAFVESFESCFHKVCLHLRSFRFFSCLPLLPHASPICT